MGSEETYAWDSRIRPRRVVMRERRPIVEEGFRVGCIWIV